MNTTTKYRMMFFAPLEGEGGGGGGEMSRGEAVFDEPKQTTHEHELPTGDESRGTSGAGTEEPAAQPAAQPPSFDPQKFAQEFGTTFAESIRPTLEKREAPKMTPEEARKLLQVWEPDDAWYAKYDNLDTRKQAMAEMRDALVNQADVLSRMRMREMFEEFHGRISPQLALVQQFHDQQRDDRFLGTYPQLNQPALRPLIKAVADDLAARKQSFGSEGEAFTALAKGVESVIKVNNPEFQLVATPNGGAAGQPGRARQGLPTMTPGASGGTGRREGAQKGEKPRGLAVFDKPTA